MPFRLNDLPDYSDIQENEILYNTTYAPGPNSNFINRVYSSVSEMFASINRSASNLFSSRQPLSRCRAQHRGNIFRLPPGLRNLGNTCYMNSLLQVTLLLMHSACVPLPHLLHSYSLRSALLAHSALAIYLKMNYAPMT